MIEPSNAEQALWPDATRDYVQALTAENERLAKAWKNKHAYQVREAKSHSEYFDKSQRRMHELTAENERLREALEWAADYEPWLVEKIYERAALEGRQ